MTVEDLSRRLSSYELSQWIAFERVNGPLGPQYTNDMLASIHEQLQFTNFILGRMSSGEDSPVPVPHRVRRPHEVLHAQEVQVVEQVEDDPDVAAAELQSFMQIMQAKGQVARTEPELLPGY